jgi:hypothetical protein
MGFRRETPADDNNRTERLLDQADTAFGDAPATAFETVVTTGLGTDKAAAVAGNYPPSGHGYPRRG